MESVVTWRVGGLSKEVVSRLIRTLKGTLIGVMGCTPTLTRDFAGGTTETRETRTDPRTHVSTLVMRKIKLF